MKVKGGTLPGKEKGSREGGEEQRESNGGNGYD
jgi:hypothetical protein